MATFTQSNSAGASVGSLVEACHQRTAKHSCDGAQHCQHPLAGCAGLAHPSDPACSSPGAAGSRIWQRPLPELFEDCDFPVIVRPIGSQAGRDLDKIDTPEEITAYLAKVEGTEFFLSRFIDYSGKDGLFREFRVALIDGEAFACHMAVSSNWMVHYVNAGMYQDAQKRN